MASPRPITRKSSGATTDSTSRRSSLAGSAAASPFRQASLRLGSPVPGRSMADARRASSSASAVAGSGGPYWASSNGGTETPRSQLSGFDEEVFTDRRQPEPHRYSTTSAGGLSRAMLGASVGSGAIADDGSAISASEVSIDIDHPDPEVVKVVGRHLVREGDEGGAEGTDEAGGSSIDDKFKSLKLQGGDITRQLYNWQREHEEAATSELAGRRGRSRSFDIPRPAPEGVKGPIDTKNIKAPGGFRRNFLAQKSQQPFYGATDNPFTGRVDQLGGQQGEPAFLTRNFIEFLSIYGHFAGEELEDEEAEALDTSEEDEFERVNGGGQNSDEGSGEDEPTEHTRLVRRPKMHRRKSSHHHGPGNASSTKAVLLLLKSFVGTGVLFLPKAFFNGGILFSSILLLVVSIISYWCFLLLIASKKASGVSSFGDIGGELYGPRMRQLILASIVMSQIGFAAAYIVFVSENLQAFILAISNGTKLIPIPTLITLQLIVFLPLSMIRDIAKLSGTALVADFFILLGLVYLYFYGTKTIFERGVADVVLFNSQSWTLFIGTAIFTFEGIGLIIPIQESMKYPQQFGPVLAGVMVGITVIFVSMGTLLYSAYGSKVETVIILNLPQDSHFVNGVQLLYSLAILLSTPLQLFPAIRIIETSIFSRSGKFNTRIKWQKNVFRFCLTIFTAFVAWGGADDLDKFVALTGSFACVPLVYIYPPLLHMRAVPQSKTMFMADMVLCIFGFIVMVYTTWQTMASWIQG